MRRGDGRAGICAAPAAVAAATASRCALSAFEDGFMSRAPSPRQARHSRIVAMVFSFSHLNIINFYNSHLY